MKWKKLVMAELCECTGEVEAHPDSPWIKKTHIVKCHVKKEDGSFEDRYFYRQKFSSYHNLSNPLFDGNKSADDCEQRIKDRYDQEAIDYYKSIGLTEDFIKPEVVFKRAVDLDESFVGETLKAAAEIKRSGEFAFDWRKAFRKETRERLCPESLKSQDKYEFYNRMDFMKYMGV